MKRIFLLALLVLSISLSAQEKTYTNLMEAFRFASTLSGDPAPSGIRWIEGQAAYSFTKRGQGGKEIWKFNIDEQQEELVFSSAGLLFPESEQVFSYHGFQWASNYSKLLFQTNFESIWRNSGNANYYLYDLESKSMQEIVTGAFTAEVSPDGSMVGYGKEGNLFTYDLQSGTHKQLTDDGAKDFYNGRFGWANEEEFGLVQAWEWSHDSRYIAFWQTDETQVPLYQLTDFQGQHPAYMELPYPKVGDDPPLEKLGVLDVKSGEKRWLNIDPQGGYMPRIYWTSKENTLAVVWLNRAQTHMKLYLFDVSTGEGHVIMEEENEAWIDVFDFFAGEMHYFNFPEDMDSFFWISDRDGYSHIYNFDYDGKMLAQITSGNFDVVGLKSLNSETNTLSYLSCEVSPLERKLFSINLKGKAKKQLTKEEGNHRVQVSPDGKYFIDTYSSVSTPRSTYLKNGKGKVLKELAGHEGALIHMEQYAYAPRELFSFDASDGQKIDGYFIKPPDFDPAKSYPLIMAVYGGPGSQGVFNSFESGAWTQFLVQQGYVVANINNRGNGGYGSDFEKVVYKQLGHRETADFAEAATYLSKMDGIDPERIGIMGHSFGGFSAGMSMLLHGDVFKAGIVTAAISDHMNYDCVLTEKLMGLSEDNAEGYESSSMVHHAAKLEGKLLLVHSLMDDNVHPQNTFQFTSALIDARKKFDMMVYPSGNHGVAYDLSSYMHLQELYLDWLNENLKGEKE